MRFGCGHLYWASDVKAPIASDRYSSDTNNLQNIQNEMTELRAIANPDVRSAVRGQY